MRKVDDVDPQRAVARAAAVTVDESATMAEVAAAANVLIAHGFLDQADAALERIERSGAPFKIGVLKATSHQLRRSGIVADLRPLGSDSDGFSGSREALVYKCERPTDRTVVVFTGRILRLYLSLQVFHQFMTRYDANLIYMSDSSGHLYFKGLPGLAEGYDAILDLIRNAVAGFGSPRLFVMANSGGGFAGLRAAADLQAESYVGFGIRTDSSPGSTLPRGGGITAKFPADTDPKLRIDLRQYLAGKAYPTRAHLYCGDLHEVDSAHAENMRGLPNFKITRIPGYSGHHVISALLAKGEFEAVLNEFLAVDGEPKREVS